MMLSNEDLQRGVVCECCGQYAKEYSHPLNTNMMRKFIACYKITKHGGFASLADLVNRDKKVRKLTLSTGNFPLLRHWGLIRSPSEDEIKAGYRGWAITPKGIDFYYGKIKVPQKVLIYNGECRGFAGEETDISEAFEHDFDLDELFEPALPIQLEAPTELDSNHT